MGCSCSSICNTALPIANRPLGRLSVTTREGVPIPLQFFNLRFKYTILISGAAIKPIAAGDLSTFAQIFTRELECNLMAFWTETPRRGSLSDFESVLWFASSCTRHTPQQILIYSCEEEAGECLRLCGRLPDVAGLVLSLTRCSVDGLRTVVKVMEKADPITCPILLLHAMGDYAGPLLTNSLFFCGSERRTAREITKKGTETLSSEVIRAMFGFLRSIRTSD